MNQLRLTPNLLTLLRLCLVPFLALSILDGYWRLALALFVLAGLSDGLDGLVARRLRQHSRLGQYLDPVADKLLLSTLFLVLHHAGLVSRQVTVLVFGRDLGILVVGATLFGAAGMRNFKPSVWGKANTFAQIVALSAVLLAQALPAAWVVWVREAALRATEVLTCLSGFDYAVRVPKRLGAAESTL